MKKYNIFISHTKSDKHVASELNRFLNNEFNGNIKTYFAINEIKAGDNWKNEIKGNLEQCDAIISLVTKNSIIKPWIFIEWSAFWIANKKIYILIAEDINYLDLIHPMQDSQLVTITDLDSIKGFIQRLSEDANHDLYPYDKAESLIISIKSAIHQQELEIDEKSYSKYKNNLDVLPNDDNEKEKIAVFFLENEEYDIFKKVVSKIRTDRIKQNLVRRLFDLAKINIALELTESIRSAEIQSEIVIESIELNYEDSPRIKSIIDDISNKSQAQLRVITLFLAENGMEDTNIFFYIIDTFSNMAELRKICNYFILNNRFKTKIFSDIVDKILINNRAELRKVGYTFIENNVYDNDYFINLVTKLASKNQKEAIKLLLELKKHDPKLFDKLISKNIITDTESLDQIN